MSDLPDEYHVREILRRLEEIQRESVELRQRIEQIRSANPEFPARRPASDLFEGIGARSPRRRQIPPDS
jgi:hypothetical protein